MLRMRVLAAATARCMRSAPCVMLPASTTCRNSLRSIRSNRIAAFADSESGFRRIPMVPVYRRAEHSAIANPEGEAAMAAFDPLESHAYDVVVIGAGGAGLRATLGLAAA